MWRPMRRGPSGEPAVRVGQLDVARQVESQRRRALGVGEIRAGQVGRAAQHFGQGGGEGLQRELRGLARSHGLGLGMGGDCRVDGDLREVARQLALHAPAELGRQFGMGRAIGGKAPVPFGLHRLALGAGVPVAIDLLRHRERLMRPTHGIARELDFFQPERLAVRLGGVGPVRAGLADVRLRDHQRGAVGAAPGVGDGAVHRVDVVAVDRADDVPAIGLEPGRRVVDEPGRHRAVDRDAVVVIDGDQLGQLPGAGQRAGFVADAFHQAPVAHQHIGVVVDDGVAFAVELRGQQFLGQRHAHRVADALAQRAGGGLHTGRDADLGMTGGLAVQLAEILQLADRQVVARQVQQRVNQHGGVTVRQHEAVAVEPVRIQRVVPQVPPP